MTATLHKITAGDGYLYYTQQVAVGDESDTASTMSNYYSAKGESPGWWLGSGLADLSTTYRDEVITGSKVVAGSRVTEDQMYSLFGQGNHPNADAIADHVTAVEIQAGASTKQATVAAERASRLGAPFRQYDGGSEYRKRCARAFADHNTRAGLPATDAISDEQRSTIRTSVAEKMFREQFSRPPLDKRELSGWVARVSRQSTVAVAGFDWTFQPVKSVSAVWALAPPEIAAKFERAHHKAVRRAMAYLEKHATFTRLGRNGVRQVAVGGLVCAVFFHRDSRARDPSFHSHVVTANRVRTAEGLWRTIDGSMFYKSAVAASEIYNTGLEIELLNELSPSERNLYGVEFAERPNTDPSKRPVREIVGVSAELLEFWSKRDSVITARLGQLTVSFEQTHGREPRPDELFKLTQQAILETRPAKKSHRSRAEQRAQWRADAVTLLGGADRVNAMLGCTLRPRRLAFPLIDGQWIAERAAEVVATVSAERSTWRYQHVRAEAERAVRGKLTSPEQWESVVDQIVSEAVAPDRVIARGDPDIAAEPDLRTPPEIYRREDGTSVYSTVASQSYTNAETLLVEARLIEMVEDRGGWVVPGPVVEDAVRAFDRSHPGTRLNHDQVAVIRRFAGSGNRIDIANAPAGTGKTTAMGVLAQAWHRAGGAVLGLAPTAAAAHDLGIAIEARTETLDKLLFVLDSHTPSAQRLATHADPPSALPQWVLDIDDRTLVIIDEHVRITDRKRLQALLYLGMRGATVRFLGDLEQLPAIGAGGAAADMVDAAEAITLSNVVRFATPAEGAASLLLREGDPAGLGFYVDRGRVHVGGPASVVDAAYIGWSADIDAGIDAILLAPTHLVVGELNERARADRLARAGGLHGVEVALADGLAASVGDTICTTSNNRDLPTSSGDFVRNGYRWLVTDVAADGRFTVSRLSEGQVLADAVVLPADYVAAHVRLGYASTIDSVQGVTAGTCHTVLRGSETRNQLYVALTRGRFANHLYLTTTLEDSEIAIYTDLAAHPRTAVEALVAMLSRTRKHTSAHTELRTALDPLERLGRAIDVYLDAVGLAIEHALGPAALSQIDTAAEQLYPGLTGCPAWPVLRQHLATLALDGQDPRHALAEAIDSRELGTANDAAAVLDWRLDTSGAHSVPEGPLPWLPGIPTAVREDTAVAGFLDARSRIITDLASQIHFTTRDFTALTAPVWARPLLGADPRLLGDLAVWRAANHVQTADARPTGPRRYTVVERGHQAVLDARVTEAIGDIHLPATKWEPVIKRVEARILSDPFWPILADRLETAARAGIDVEAMLDAVAAPRPLPDELPAAALWSRLELDPAAMSGAGALSPEWTSELVDVIGPEPAQRIMNDPAWPKIVAAVEAAEASGWTPFDILTTAAELLATDRGDNAVRPDQLATALAWCIDAIVYHVPTTAPPQSNEPPPTEPPFPDPLDRTAHSDPAPEDTVMPEPEPSQSALPPPAPLAVGILVVAELFGLGAHRNGSIELSRVLAAATEEERRTVMRVESTLLRYPFVIARARLQAAARDNPHLGELIRACIPVTDPHVYRPTTASPDTAPQSPPASPPPIDVSQLQWMSTPANDTERRTLRRILKTLENYPFPEARSRLRAAARDLPEHGEYILRNLPPADPGLYEPNGQPQGWAPQRKTRSRIDPSRRVPPEHQHGPSRVVEDYFAEQSDRYLTHPSPDDRTRYTEYSTPRPTTSPETPDMTEGRPSNHNTSIDRRSDQPHKPDSTFERGDRGKTRRPPRISEKRDYDGGEFEPTMENLRGLACVACLLERPVADTGTSRSAHIHTVDDGLCTDCRDAGRPGIPEHTPADHLRARCQFITDTHGAVSARGLLRRDYRNSPSLAVRVAIAEWVADNLPPVEPAPVSDTTIEARNPLLALTDTELDALAQDLRQRIGLADTDTILTNIPPAVEHETAPAEDLGQMQAAVAAARDAQSVFQEIGTQLQAARSAVRDTREQLEATSRLSRGDRRQLETQLTSLTRTRDNLEAQLGYARQAAREAHRDAVLQAGPETGWERILRQTGPVDAAPAAQAHRDEVAAKVAAARENAEQLKQQWQRELDAADTERQRRDALTPDQHSHEEQQREQNRIEAHAPYDAALSIEAGSEVDQHDAGL